MDKIDMDIILLSSKAAISLSKLCIKPGLNPHLSITRKLLRYAQVIIKLSLSKCYIFKYFRQIMKKISFKTACEWL